LATSTKSASLYTCPVLNSSPAIAATELVNTTRLTFDPSWTHALNTNNVPLTAGFMS
jgi:hypothetical protein